MPAETKYNKGFSIISSYLEANVRKQEIINGVKNWICHLIVETKSNVLRGEIATNVHMVKFEVSYVTAEDKMIFKC